MTNFHKNFPFGKGQWIWELNSCLGGNLDAIVQKCKEYHIDYLFIKNADGPNSWEQWTPELVAKIKGAGIKLYSWSFIYGNDPAREAALTLWALDMGIDGHIFDIEEQYPGHADAPARINQMMDIVRAKHPEAFIGFSTFANPDSHATMPYATLGNRMDAYLPQIYFAKWKMTPNQAINWCYEQWVRWIKHWTDTGECVNFPPVIPTMQAFDDYDQNTYYVLKPADIADFINSVKGYQSVNFWSFQHVLRSDCWDAIRDNNVNPAPQAQQVPTGSVTGSELATPTSLNTTTTPSSTQPATPPAAEMPSQPQTNPITASETVTTTTTTTVGTKQEAPASATPVTVAENKPVDVPLPAVVTVPKGTKVTITPNPEAGTVRVQTHLTHLDYFLMALHWILSLGGLLKKGGKK
jgi:hypothetical protein